MKLAHLSKNAGQIVNEDKTVKALSDYIVQVQNSEKLVDQVKQKAKSFDSWINEPVYHVGEGRWMSRAELWDDAEIYAAKVGWEAALKGKKWWTH